MKEYSQKLSSVIDNELDDEIVINTIISDIVLQKQFSRYQLIGDAMREEGEGFDLCIDVTDNVMVAIANEKFTSDILPFPQKAKLENNVMPFAKRFGQYAIAASVAGVVVVSSLMFNQNAVVDSSFVPVLNTVPFGGAAAPVSLQTLPTQSKNDLKERNERLEALLKDHQLQLQIQP